MRITARTAAASFGLALVLAAGAAFGADTGQPHPWGTGLQAPATEVMHRTTGVHNMIMVIITIICIFVIGLLGYTIWRFSEKRNPTPARFTHNALIEVVWTLAPVLILVVIAIPSIRLLYLQEEIPTPDLTIKATGHQWYWEYAYDVGAAEPATFDSVMLDKEKAAAANLPYRLGVDNPMVVPVGKVVRLQLTASTVIHSWAVPSFSVKTDAVPGRLNQTWFRVDAPGVYYGQCSELCGKDHSYMPVMVKAVSPEEFEAWKGATLKAGRVDPQAASFASR